MIVTCPSCEAKYRVNAEALEKRRGKVKCANCAHVWTVEDEALTLSEPVAAPEPAPAPEPEPQPSLREKPHAAIRAREDARRRKARLATEGAGWAGVAACVMVLLGAAVMFRVDVVEVWPRTAGAYAAVGLEVNPYGVEIEGLNATLETQDGEAVLMVSGALRNISGEERPAPMLRAVAYGEDGTELSAWPLALEAPSLGADAAAPFEAILPAPPEAAVRIEVVVAE
jgi:predicted Zn finger-like uncharacterized protein